MTASLPAPFHDALAACSITEFATTSGAGLPIDTPLLCFPGDDTVEVTTGLAYPAKAERARQRPQVGLLLEPNGGPTVLVAALASVRDTDIEANARRYARLPLARASGGEADWAQARKAIWYWARIWIECTPVKMWWWPSDDGGPPSKPSSWTAPADIQAPASDPAPVPSATAAPTWIRSVWQEKAAQVSGQVPGPHLTLATPDGWPLPLRVDPVTVAGDGFDIVCPAWAPWAFDGPATLCFEGKTTFVGRCHDAGDRLHLSVERTLPTLPMVADPKEVMRPRPDTRAKLLGRLEAELARRGQKLFRLPEDETLL